MSYFGRDERERLEAEQWGDRSVAHRLRVAVVVALLVLLVALCVAGARRVGSAGDDAASMLFETD